MDNITIREAKLRDASQIAKVHVETWQYAYKGQLPDTFLDSLSIEQRTKVWKENLSNSPSKTKKFVAVIKERIVGFVSVGSCRDDDMNKNTGELWAIYVDPDYMGKGVGSALIKVGLDYLKKFGFNKATLWVLISNKKTRKWYESRGWKIEGKNKSEPRDSFELKEIRYIINL